MKAEYYKEHIEMIMGLWHTLYVLKFRRNVKMKRYFFVMLCGSLLLNLSGCKEQDKAEEREKLQTNAIVLNDEKTAAEQETETTEICLEPTEDASRTETAQAVATQAETSQAETSQAETTQAAADQEEGTQREADSGKANQAEFLPSSFYGVWKVKDYQPCSVSALSQQEIQGLLKEQVAYYEDRFLQNGALIETENFGYEFSFLTLDEIMDGYRVDLSDWQEENTELAEGTISDLNECFGKYFFTAGQDNLWVYYEGVFFQMEKVGN